MYYGELPYSKWGKFCMGKIFANFMKSVITKCLCQYGNSTVTVAVGIAKFSTGLLVVVGCHLQNFSYVWLFVFSTPVARSGLMAVFVDQAISVINMCYLTLYIRSYFNNTPFLRIKTIKAHVNNCILHNYIRS